MDTFNPHTTPLVDARVISVPFKGGKRFINTDEVSFVQSVRRGCIIHFLFNKPEPFRTSYTLDFIVALYSRIGFIRIHRTLIVNMKHVKEFQNGKDGIVYLKDGRSLIVSRNYIAEFKRLMGY